MNKNVTTVIIQAHFLHENSVAGAMIAGTQLRCCIIILLVFPAVLKH